MKLDIDRIIDFGLLVLIVTLAVKILLKLNSVAMSYRQELSLQNKRIKHNLFARLCSLLAVFLFVNVCLIGLYYLFKWGMILLNTAPSAYMTELMYMVIFMLLRIGGLFLLAVFTIGVLLYILFIKVAVHTYIIKPTAVDIEQYNKETDDETKEI